MSEQRKQPNFVPMWLYIFHILILLVFTIAMAFEADSKLRDLQRRVGQLEEQVKR